MALTIKRQDTETVTKEWQRIFGTTETLSSTVFMQKLAIIGLSNITYLREVFPSQCYDFSKIDQMVIPILKENTSCQESNLFYKWLKSSFEAFDKKYLKKMTLGFYEDESRRETIIESYSFCYRYAKDEFIIESNGKNRQKKSIFTNSVKQSTEDLIKCFKVIFNLMDPLPEDYDIILHLLYYDGVTPADYEPEGFVPCHDDCTVDGSINYMIGSVATANHKLKLLAHQKSDLTKRSPIPSDITEAEESVDKEVSQISAALQNDTDINSNKDNSLKEDFEEMSLSVTNSVFQMNNENDTTIRCPCTMMLESDQCMVNCNECKSWQHAACFGLFANDEYLLQNHICDVCAAENPELICTDPSLNNMAAQKKKEICLFRNILAYCVFYRAIDVAVFMEMFSISQRNTIRVFQRLSAYGVIQFSAPSNSQTLDNNKSYNINLPRLKENALLRFFPKSSIDIQSQSDDLSHLSRSQNYDAIRDLSQTHQTDYNGANISPILNFKQHTTPRTDKFMIPTSAGRKSSRVRKATKRYLDEILESPVHESKKSKRSTTQLSLKKKNINI